MSPQETARANLERLSAAANAMQSYLLGFVTQADINRIGEDLTRLRAVLAVTDLNQIDDVHDLDELRERLNSLRSSVAVLLVSLHAMHEKAEAMHATLTHVEDAIDNPDEVL